MTATGPDIGIRPATSRDYVAAELRQAIVRGELQGGDKLNPSDIAERYGVSQTPVREALQLLTSENLVRNDAFRGARVAELNADEYEELYLMRVGLEDLAARLGADRISDEGVKELAELLDQMASAARAGDIDRFYALDRQFHLIHYGASGRESLVNRIMQLRVASERYGRVAYELPRVSMNGTLETHRELLAATRSRDGDRCAAVLRDDLTRTLEAFKERFGEDSRGNAS